MTWFVLHQNTFQLPTQKLFKFQRMETKDLLSIPTQVFTIWKVDLTKIDATKVLTYRISGVGGVWDQYKQTTTLTLFVDGVVGQQIAAQVTYDFTGDGTVDRTEVFKPLTIDGNPGFQEWLVSGDANGLQQVPATTWAINTNNGIVELKVFIFLKQF